MNIDLGLYPHGSFIHTMGINDMKKKQKKKKTKLTYSIPTFFSATFPHLVKYIFFKIAKI
jgi:hypothetical protein